MRLTERFERIHVINLRSRPDRRREITAQLRRVGLSFDDPQVRLFEAVRPGGAAGFESIGARGCFLSHLGVLRQAMSLSSVLVLEDDLDFSDDIEHRLSTAIDAIPDDWGIFYGGARAAVGAGEGPLTRVAPDARIVTAHFVAFRRPVVESLVAYLDAILARPPGHVDGGPMHVDGAYQRYRIEHPQVATYVATPELGHQRASRTDIHALRWFDRLPIVRQAAGAARRLVR